MADPIGAFSDIIVELGKLGNLLQALGIIVVAWIIFETIALIVNRKKRKAIYQIRDDLQRVEQKIDQLLAKKK